MLSAQTLFDNICCVLKSKENRALNQDLIRETAGRKQEATAEVHADLG